MLRLLPLALVLLLGGCDAFGSDTGDADLTLSGSRSGTVRGNANFGVSATDASAISVGLFDDDTGRAVRLTFPGPIAVGAFAVGEEVSVRYSRGGILTDSVTGTAGTVTITEASSREVRGRIDVGASIYNSDPILQISGPFRAVDR